jgi:phospholipid N-methyltransferase
MRFDLETSPRSTSSRSDISPAGERLGGRSGDVLAFLQDWAQNPGRVGAIAPSGAALARLITREISAATGPVVELGPGTGVFTRALLDRGVREQDLVLVESGEAFARLLQHRFPAARVLGMDAARLGRERLVAGRAVGAVVSGLPLLNMPPRKVMAILAGAFAQLGQGGAFYQFTYGLGCPVRRRMLDRLGLKATLVGRALLNMPPASVYRITRRAPLPIAHR